MRLSTEENWNKIYSDIESRYSLYAYQPQLVDVIRQAIGTPSGKRILEVGCGKGNELIHLAREGAECSGLDFSHSAIRFLGERLRREEISISLVHGDAISLPFVSETFDLVFSQGVLEHFTDPSIPLKEQRRVLRLGGHVVAEVPNKLTLYTVYKKILMLFNRWPPGWETQYSPRELKQMLSRSEIQVINCVGWDFFVFKIIRKLRKLGGIRDQGERKITRSVRHRLEGNPFLLNLFESIIIVGRKTS